MRRDDLLDAADDRRAGRVDAPLVEEHDDGRDRAVLRDQIAAEQIVVDRALRRPRRAIRVSRSFDEPAHVEHASSSGDAGGRASTIVAVARLLTRSTASTRSMSPRHLLEEGERLPG